MTSWPYDLNSRQVNCNFRTGEGVNMQDCRCHQLNAHDFAGLHLSTVITVINSFQVHQMPEQCSHFSTDPFDKISKKKKTDMMVCRSTCYRNSDCD